MALTIAHTFKKRQIGRFCFPHKTAILLLYFALDTSDSTCHYSAHVNDKQEIQSAVDLSNHMLYE